MPKSAIRSNPATFGRDAGPTTAGPSHGLRSPSKMAATPTADLEALIRTLEAEPETAEGAEAGFRLGLHALFVTRDADAAMDGFRAAIRAGHEPWRRQARISAAQVLTATARPQQAAFELRKAVTEGPEDLVGAQARALLVDVLRQLGKGKEAERLRDAQKAALGALAQGEGSEAALAEVWLGYEHKHDGERKPAKLRLEAALSRPELPDDARAQAERVLSEL